MGRDFAGFLSPVQRSSFMNEVMTYSQQSSPLRKHLRWEICAGACEIRSSSEPICSSDASPTR